MCKYHWLSQRYWFASHQMLRPWCQHVATSYTRLVISLSHLSAAACRWRVLAASNSCRTPEQLGRIASRTNTNMSVNNTRVVETNRLSGSLLTRHWKGTINLLNNYCAICSKPAQSTRKCDLHPMLCNQNTCTLDTLLRSDPVILESWQLGKGIFGISGNVSNSSPTQHKLFSCTWSASY